MTNTNLTKRDTYQHQDIQAMKEYIPAKSILRNIFSQEGPHCPDQTTSCRAGLIPSSNNF